METETLSDITALATIEITALAPLADAKSEPSSRNPADVYIQAKAPGSRRTLEGALHTIAQILTGGRRDAYSIDRGAVRYEHAAAVLAELAERFAASNANKTLSALRGVLKEAWRLGQIGTEEYQRAIDLPNIKGETLPRGRAIAYGELRALFSACADGTPAGARDAALLSLLYGAGLRRAEVVALSLADYEIETGALAVRHGKGNKWKLNLQLR